MSHQDAVTHTEIGEWEGGRKKGKWKREKKKNRIHELLLICHCSPRSFSLVTVITQLIIYYGRGCNTYWRRFFAFFFLSTLLYCFNPSEKDCIDNVTATIKDKWKRRQGGKNIKEGLDSHDFVIRMKKSEQRLEESVVKRAKAAHDRIWKTKA